MTDCNETSVTTHADDCWGWGPKHYKCAVREIEALRAELDESCAVGDKLARLLAETAIVVKGPEPDMTQWSYHDIPDGVRAIQARAERLAEALAELITWIPSADTYRRLGFDPEAPMRALREAKEALGMGGLSND